jgi:protein O-mannosyl-transferase
MGPQPVRGSGKKQNPPLSKNQIKSKSGSLPEKRIGIILILFILVFTGFIFSPTLNNDFISTWDDGVYVTDNLIIHQLNTTSVKAMFTTPLNGTYVPLPLLSFAIEYRFFKLNPYPYHVTNLLLHLLCVFLVFQLLRFLKLKPVYAAIGTILFAIHPLRVESVAWITERKDLLFGLFYLLSMICYIQYLESKKNRLLFLSGSLLFFIFALLSKIQAVTLPLSLLLIDYYRMRDLKIRLVIEKVPYFTLSLVFGIAGIFILKNQGVLDAYQNHSLVDRVFLGLYGLSAYIIKFVAPLKSCLVYPYPDKTGSFLPFLYYLSPVFLVIILFLVYKSLRFTRVIAFGFVFFIFNIMFLLQILGAGHAFIADRFTYIPYIGLGFIVAWFLQNTYTSKKHFKHLVSGLIIVMVAGFSYLTYSRCIVWQNSETIWTDVMNKYPMLHISYENRGNYLAQHGRHDQALKDFMALERFNSKNPKVYSNLGNLYGILEQFDKSLASYSKAISMDSNTYEAFMNRGITYAHMKELPKAIADFNKALELKPNTHEILVNRAFAYLEMGEFAKSIQDYTYLIKNSEPTEDFYLKRGLALFRLGKFTESINDFNACLAINPGNTIASMNISVIFNELQKFDSAMIFAQMTKAKGGTVDQNYLDKLQSRLKR